MSRAQGPPPPLGGRVCFVLNSFGVGSIDVLSHEFNCLKKLISVQINFEKKLHATCNFKALILDEWEVRSYTIIPSLLTNGPKNIVAHNYEGNYPNLPTTVLLGLWSGRTGSQLPMNRLSLRNNQLKFKTAWKSWIILEESIEYTPI